MMPSFHDIIVPALYGFSPVIVLFVGYMVRLFVQNLMGKDNLLEQYIKNNWNSWKYSWLARNFDFTALFFISIPALTLFFFGLPSGITVYSIIEKYTLLIGALLGFPILIKRVGINQETLKETQEQTRISREQLHFSQISDSYGKLWSSDLGTRMTAIEVLWNFAQEYPKGQYKKVMDGFTQFIKYPAPYKWEEGTKEEAKKAGRRADIAAILRHMGEEREAEANPYRVDLGSAHLEGAFLDGAYLEGALLWNTHLEGALLTGAVLWGAHLDDAHLEGARLFGTDLGVAYLRGANLTLAIINNADFTGVTDLKQEQINECVFLTDRSYHNKQPILPDGIKPNYKNMSIKEWEDASGREFYDFATW